MSSYPVAGRPVGVSADEGDLPAGVTVAVPLCCLVSPLKNGAPVEDGDRSALAVAGAARSRTGEPVVFLKAVAGGAADVGGEGRVRAAGGPGGRGQHAPAGGGAAGGKEHRDGDGQPLTIGRDRPLAAHSMDGSLLRVPDTPANRAAFGSVGTADDSAAWPSVRLFPLNNCLTRSLLAMPWGPAGTDKAAAEQGLLDTVLAQYPHVPAQDQGSLLDRLWHGVRRIAAPTARPPAAIPLESD